MIEPHTATAPLLPVLIDNLADSLAGPVPGGTPRRVFGAVRLPGKAMAVVRMRRAGKTMFLRQLRRERLAQGIERGRLPYLNFEVERLAGLIEDAQVFPRAGPRLLALTRDGLPAQIPPGVTAMPTNEWMLAGSKK